MEQARNNYKVIIAGSRTFNDYDLLHKSCDDILKAVPTDKDIIIVSGTARGADSLGEKYALERGYTIERHSADWEKYGKSAGMIRNAEMAKEADALICFWDGKSKGTQNMIHQARKLLLDVHLVWF